MSSSAIYAGTFDPITLGHLDLVKRAASIFDTLTLAVAASVSKSPFFSLDERVALAKKVVADFPNVKVDSFTGLLVDYAHACGVHVIVRGLRAFSDFESEFQMALMNRKMAEDVETLFLMPNENYSYVSSSSVQEIAELGGDISDFVPVQVLLAMKNKINLG